MRTWIKNGLIYDGSGEIPYVAGIVVEDGKIAAITKDEDICIDQVEDASGYVVTPGFIDTHRHCDIDVLNNPEFGHLELAQGLTSVVAGNCGLAPIPAPEDRKQEIFDYIEPCLGIWGEMPGIVRFGDYLTALEKKRLPLNFGSYIGLGTLKAAIKGYGKSPFTREEMELVKTYIREGMVAGALGLSMGIMYQPECYSSRGEIVEMISASAPYGRPLTCHIRGEGDNLIPSVDEILEIAREAQVPVNISHFKSTGVKNWGNTIGLAIERVEKARSQGQDVTVDFYPYCGGSTTVLSLIPPAVMEDSLEATLRKLGTKRGVEQMKQALYREHEGWDNMVTAIGWERILISSVTREENRRFAGLDMKAAAALAGYQEPVEFLCCLASGEQGKVGIIVLSMSQEDVDAVARLPYSMVISDALYSISDCPHPRLYGSFSKVIREYVREREVLTMEEAIRKMTMLPAMRLNLSGRGQIREGYAADLNIFQPELVKDRAVYGDSRQLSEGLHLVMANGLTAIRDGMVTGENAGNVLKIN